MGLHLGTLGIIMVHLFRSWFLIIVCVVLVLFGGHMPMYLDVVRIPDRRDTPVGNAAEIR